MMPNGTPFSVVQIQKHKHVPLLGCQVLWQQSRLNLKCQHTSPAQNLDLLTAAIVSSAYQNDLRTLETIA